MSVLMKNSAKGVVFIVFPWTRRQKVPWYKITVFRASGPRAEYFELLFFVAVR